MKGIRKIALTSYYPYGKYKENIIAERTEQVDKAISEHDAEIRADEKGKVLDEAIENIIPTLYENNVDEETINTCKRLFEQMKGDTK